MAGGGTPNPRRAQRRVEPQNAESGGASGDDPPWALDGVRRIAVGAVSGLGLVGLVVLVGGAIEWARFNSLGLPADQAVAAIPKQQLLTVGAVSLSVFVLVGLVAVAIAHAIDPHGAATSRMGAYVALLVVIGGVAAVAVDLSFAHVAVAVGTGAGLAVLSLLVARRTGTRFVGFGCAVVLLIAVFGGVFAYLLNDEEPQAQAVAALGRSGGGLTGIFVASDNDHVWIGRVDPGGLLVLSCKSVSAIAIGRVESGGTEARASELLRRLQGDRAALTGGPAEALQGLC